MQSVATGVNPSQFHPAVVSNAAKAASLNPHNHAAMPVMLAAQQWPATQAEEIEHPRSLLGLAPWQINKVQA